MQTLREALEEWVEEHVGHHDAPARAASLVLQQQLRHALALLNLAGLADLPILEGVGLVATDLEAGAKVAAGLDAPPGRSAEDYWHDIDSEAQGARIADVQAILTACGIIVPDEVVELTPDDRARCEMMADGRLAAVVRLEPGSSVLVTRQSVLHLPVKEGE